MSDELTPQQQLAQLHKSKHAIASVKLHRLLEQKNAYMHGITPLESRLKTSLQKSE